jgi:hypothetical protein
VFDRTIPFLITCSPFGPIATRSFFMSSTLDFRPASSFMLWQRACIIPKRRETRSLEGEEIPMKFENIIRKGLIVAGFSTALVLLPASVKAQEISNTEFTDGPNVTALAQPSVSQQAVTTTMPSSQALQANESISSAYAPSEQASLIQVPAPSEAWVTAALLVGILLIALYALAEAKRANRVLNSTRSY